MTDRKAMPEQAKKKEAIYKETRDQESADKLVKEITQISFTGNVIPLEWFKHITVKTKKKTRPHLLAINILADVVYWYKGRKIRDERSGQAKKTEKKFKGDLLQRSYAQIANTFGVSKAQARLACKVLESHGLIYCHMKTVKTDNRTLSNVMFIEPYPAKIYDITHEKTVDMQQKNDTPSDKILREGCGKILGQGVSEFSETYTENTDTKNSITKNTNTETVSDEKKSETEQPKDPSPSLSGKPEIPSQSEFDAFKAEYESLFLFSQKVKSESNRQGFALEQLADKLDYRLDSLRLLFSNFSKSWYGVNSIRPNPEKMLKFLTEKADSLSMNYKGETTAAQRDKFGGDDSTVQKIANEAVRRVEEEAAAYLANGGLTF
jgi:hypothetical protein